MSHNKIIQAIRIYCDTLVTETPALGVYTNGSISEIRISEEPLVGAVLTWASGLIAPNGISPRTESGDTRRGGCVAEYGGLSVSLVHTNRWLLELEALGIELGNLTVELWEFVGTEADSDATSAGAVYTGIIAEGRAWDEAGISIPIKNGTYRRNASILSTAASGVVIPATFGTHTPPAPDTVINNLAKFVRTVDTYDESIYTNAYWLGTYPEIKVFPVKLIYGGDVYYGVKLNGTVSSYTYFDPVDTYVVVVSGDGEGQIRQVVRFLDDPANNAIEFVVDGVFEEQLSILNDDTGSWVAFVKIGRDYSADSWPCKDFLKSADGAATETPELFSYAEDTFNRIADFGFRVIDSAENNSLEIDGQQYSNDIDNLESISIKPVLNVRASVEADLSGWNYGTETWWGSFGYTKIADGLYGYIDHLSGSMVDAAKAIDRLSTTYATFDCTFSQDTSLGSFTKVINFDIPEQPIGFDWDELYIGIKLNTKTSKGEVINADSSFRVMLRTWGNYKRYTILNDHAINENQVNGGDIDDIPDRYWLDSPEVNTNNLNYYRNNANTNSVTGVSYFKVNGATKDNYSAIVLGGLFFGRAIAFGNSGTDELKLYDVSFIFKKTSSSIKKEIFSPLAGRIYNDTWGGRVTATDQIAAIVPTIEHLKRLQNWGETGETGISWGKEYATTAKIKTGATEGSYDAATLPVVALALQVTSAAEGETGALVARLARAIDVCTYLDPDGTECIETLDPTDPAETITFADLNGDIGLVIEPETADIFTEPVVNYLFNQGSGEYDGRLVIKDIQKYAEGGLWSDSCSGFDSEAQAVPVLDVYAALYRKFRTTEPAPSDFADAPYFTTAAQAAAYLAWKGAHMGRRRVSLAVFYSKGSAYHFAKHVKINLPHQTRGLDVECIIESVTKDKNGNRCELKLVILSTVADVWIDTVDSTDVKIDTVDSATVVEDIAS
jgi:hypothetical protein